MTQLLINKSYQVYTSESYVSKWCVGVVTWNVLYDRHNGMSCTWHELHMDIYVQVQSLGGECCCILLI